jgi:hypothetical protein
VVLIFFSNNKLIIIRNGSSKRNADDVSLLGRRFEEKVELIGRGSYLSTSRPDGAAKSKGSHVSEEMGMSFDDGATKQLNDHHLSTSEQKYITEWHFTQVASTMTKVNAKWAKIQ